MQVDFDDISFDIFSKEKDARGGRGEILLKISPKSLLTSWKLAFGFTACRTITFNTSMSQSGARVYIDYDWLKVTSNAEGDTIKVRIALSPALWRDRLLTIGSLIIKHPLRYRAYGKIYGYKNT